MCTTDGSMPGSVAEALRMAHASMDYLNSPAAADLPAAACGQALAALGEIQAKATAAHAALLRRFGALDGHDADGYGTSSAWLAAMAKMARKDAKAAVGQMRRLTRRPHLHGALARGEVSGSWAGEIDRWLTELPAELRDPTEKILTDAAAAGAGLEDLAAITAHALRQWQATHPDPDQDDGFDDRYLHVGVTFGGAACIRGNLTPECGAAVQAVLEALGKKAGPEDTRTEHQRFHDALQAGCELLIRARMVPGRAGSGTQAIIHIPISQLRDMPGASQLEDAWIRGRLGEDGYLAGKDAEAAACDALIVPVVTGRADLTVVDTMIALVLAAIGGGHRAGHTMGGTGDSGDRDNGSAHTGDSESGGSGIPWTGDGDRENAGRAGSENGDVSAGSHGDAGSAGRERSAALSPEAYAALRYAMARLAVDLVSGPAGLAAILRTQLLEAPWNTPSLPLDIGYSDSIPAHIRRAVLLRDRRCAWPRCGRPAVYCDVHHLRHKKDGGKTTVSDCVLLCQFHHDVCIHRWGWQLILHPDGTTEARSPDGKQILRSHSPPTLRAG